MIELNNLYEEFTQEQLKSLSEHTDHHICSCSELKDGMCRKPYSTLYAAKTEKYETII